MGLAATPLVMLLWPLGMFAFSLPPSAAATARAVAMVDEEDDDDVIFEGGLSLEIYCWRVDRERLAAKALHGASPGVAGHCGSYARRVKRNSYRAIQLLHGGLGSREE